MNKNKYVDNACALRHKPQVRAISYQDSPKLYQLIFKDCESLLYNTDQAIRFFLNKTFNFDLTVTKNVIRIIWDNKYIIKRGN